jgi:hypothetical protein
MSIPPDSPASTGAAVQPAPWSFPPKGGKTLFAYGDTAQIKLSGEQTNGSMAVALSSTPPGGDAMPYYLVKLYLQ